MPAPRDGLVDMTGWPRGNVEEAPLAPGAGDARIRVLPGMIRALGEGRGSNERSDNHHDAPRAGSDVIERGLQGRRRECEVLDRLVANTRAGQSQVLVLRGAAGSGKTALLNMSGDERLDVVWRGFGPRVRDGARLRGSPRSARRCWTASTGSPVHSAEALGAALGLHSGGTPDHFLVGVAVLEAAI